MTQRFKNLAAATVTAGAALIAAPAALADTTPAADAAADAVPTTPWLALLETSSQGTWGQILDVFFGIVDAILGVMADTGFHL
ncbi:MULTISPECIES: hypothetical protein [Corynebacterium]|uniref:hypothetical protein n=1 Tax=Corynebacterium TaxID=1716 RepID=UPI001959257E|nr:MULTISPECIES: hypothetical protein [Corynebacterium]MCG7466133.1 hypothetical protein [Corynebacterium sp. ACRPJ]MCG7466988.1 hypothetical protein [Corynebacterium sp. ACRPE]MDK4230687.1 hypothetical protein [Corynebacterium tuberculostearicum]MDN8597610.1 hypothetical protein [Corynebacterium tuberculostearicum]MDV2417845.1 hypothetical protein [Corynebacterium tuberculostearicum]